MQASLGRFDAVRAVLSRPLADAGDGILGRSGGVMGMESKGEGAWKKEGWGEQGHARWEGAMPVRMGRRNDGGGGGRGLEGRRARQGQPWLNDTFGATPGVTG